MRPCRTLWLAVCGLLTVWPAGIATEPRAFLRELITKDLPVHTLVIADFAMLTQRLAEHYGIAGIDELEQLLAADPAMLALAFVGHMARYANGADLSYADRRTVDEIVAAAAPTQYGVRSLIHAIAASPLLRGTR